MKDNAQLLLVSGLIMSITLIAVSSTITHSVNLGQHQGERHDLTPLLSSIEDDFPLALEYEVEVGKVVRAEAPLVNDIFEKLLSEVKFLNTEAYVHEVTNQLRYTLEKNSHPPRKVGTTLELFD